MTGLVPGRVPGPNRNRVLSVLYRKDSFFSEEGWPERLTPFSVVASSMGDLFLISLMINVLSLALPLTLLQVYDRILQFQAVSTLSLLILGVVVALLLESIFRFGRSYIGSWIGARFEHMAACGAMERLLTTNLGEFEREGSGVHLERLNSLNILKDFYSGQAVLVILDLPFVLVFLGLIHHLAGTLVLIPISMFILFVLFVWYIGSQLHKAVKNRMVSDDRRVNFIIEVLGGIHSVKAMAMEAMMLRRYERLQEACAKGAREVGLQGADAQNIGAFFSQLSMVGVVTFGSLLVINQELTVGGLAACTMLSGRSIQPLQKAVGIWARFQTIRIARERLNAIFALPKETSTGKPGVERVEGHLEMRNVTFRYSPDLEPILKDVNLTVKPGETVAISGGNGSGKTSLLWLMMGALQPSEGQVLIDGADLATHDPHSLRSSVAYLPQVGMLFRGTIMENIHMFREEYADAAVETANRLELEDFISKLPKGYETLIDDGADESIPRGIKQRITIARALVTNPRIVLFDEANTAIDGSGDEKLKNFLEGLHGQSTLIMVTHRPSLVKLADRVFELKDGTVRPKPPRDPKPPPAAKPATTATPPGPLMKPAAAAPVASTGAP